MIPKYRQQPIRNTDEEFTPQLVIPSSPELFQHYRLALAQCAKLSTGPRLLELSQTFGKYLDQYSQQVLFYILCERFPSTSSAHANQGPPTGDIIIILNTADYCYSTTDQLEEKIKSRIDEDQRDRVDLQSSADAFMGVAGAAVRALVRKVELECDPAWREMRNSPWGRLENVGDQSSYVGELIRTVRSKAAEILSLLQHKQQYARAFCDNLVDALVTAYIANIPSCRPISEVGAEQMLLDTYALKRCFLDLPHSHTPAPDQQQQQQQPPNPAYAKRINTLTGTKLDPLLKTLQVRPSPPEALVQAYLIHIADRSDASFRAVLDLKGLPRRDQSNLVELFNAHKAAQPPTALTDRNPVVSSLQAQMYGSAAQNSTQPALSIGLGSGSPSLGSAASATGKFDAAGLGSALLSAARDGVDRFGAPVSGTGSSPSSRVTSPPPPSGTRAVEAGVKGGAPKGAVGVGGGSGMAALMAAAGEPGREGNLNESLRGIGRFFRRDVGGGSGGGAR